MIGFCSSGWLFGMDQYACVSDVGRWCIYCEKENDVAVIAFRDETGGCDFSQPLTDLHASPADQIGSDPSVPFPLNSLTYAWREALEVNYAALRANDDETATTRKFNLMTE